MRNSSSEILRAVENGESFEVTNYGRVVASLVSSHLVATELHRAGSRVGVSAANVDAVLAAFDIVDVETDDFTLAGPSVPVAARTLDVVHVAVAQDCLVAYGHRQADAGVAAGLPTVTPT